MRIIITGAFGHIGSYLSEYLSSQKHQIIKFARSHGTSADSLFDLDLSKSIDCNVHADVLIHAAATKVCGTDGILDLIRGNIDSTRNIVDFAKRNNIKHIIYFGSVSSFGNADTILRESSPRINLSDYGLTKYIGERIVEECGIPSNIIILPGVVGCGCNEVWLERVKDALSHNETVNVYNAEGSFNNVVSVKDLCDFVNTLVTTSSTSLSTEKYLLGTADTLSVRNVIEILKDHIGSDSEIIFDDSSQNGFCIDCSKAISRGYSPQKLESILRTL